MRAIEICRTAELGGHVDQCDQCGGLRISYNSCRNRHCPKCQCLDKEGWLEARKRDILLTPYFHSVFTVPEGLKPLALRNQAVIYSLLFRAASESIKELTDDPKYLGGEVGFIAVLHTWNQTLMDHPHLHCIMTGGGLSPDRKRWMPSKEKFFLPVKVLSRLFRGKFLAYLKEAYKKGALIFPGQIGVFIESSAFESISNDRLVKLEGGRVTFRYRDRSDNNTVKLMTLEASEFIRRFLLHILPDGFVKIRHYGILSNRNRKCKLAVCKDLLGAPCRHENREEESWQDFFTRITGIDPRICPYCGKGRMVLKEVLNPSAFPLPP
jgi:hypothetical protein